MGFRSGCAAPSRSIRRVIPSVLAAGIAVIAGQSGGTGTASAQPGPLGAPTIGRAIGGTQSATVEWTVPDDGGTPIVSFTITSYFNGDPAASATLGAGTVGSPLDPSAGANDAGVIPGLVDGRTYTFTVAANVASEDGPQSAFSNAVIPSKTPATQTTVVSSADPTTYGQCETFTATVLVGGGAAPTGAVTFTGIGAAQTVPVSPSPVSGGTATSSSLCALSGGTHKIVATYSDTSPAQIASKGFLLQQVNPSPAQVQIVTPGAQSGAGSISFGGTPVEIVVSAASVDAVDSPTARLSPDASPTAPTGTVTVSGTTDPLPLKLTLVNGAVAIPEKWLPAGPGSTSYELNATYNGSLDYLQSTTTEASAVSVNQASTSTLTLSYGTPSSTGSVVFTATLSPSAIDGFHPAGTVTFLGHPFASTTWAVLGSRTIATTGSASITLSRSAMGQNAAYSAIYDGGTGSWLQAADTDLLSRSPTAAESLGFLEEIAGGATTAQVAAGIVASTEYQDDLVTSWFERFLARPPSSTDLNAFVGLLGSGATDEEVIANIVGSPEFFADSGGTNSSFVNAVFTSLLSRPPSTTESQTYVTELDDSLMTPTDVATAIVTSAEYQQLLVTSWFQQFLGGAPTPTQLTYYAGLLGVGATDEDVIAQIIGTNAFALHAGGRQSAFAPTMASATVGPLVPAYINSLFSSLLGRPANSSDLVYGETVLLGGISPPAYVPTLTGTLEYQERLVTSWIETFLGRSPDGTDLSVFTAELGSGATDEDVIAQIVGSAEFFTDAGGTNTGFVQASFEDLLGRAPSSFELDYFAGQLADGASTTDVAAQILASPEYEQRIVAGWYENFLGRTPSSSEVNYWVGQLGSGATDENVIAALLGSSEYIGRVAATI